MGSKVAISVARNRQNSPYFLLTFFTSLCLFLFSVLYSTNGSLAFASTGNTNVKAAEPHHTTLSKVEEWSNASLESVFQLSAVVESQALSIILPVSPGSLPELPTLLAPFMTLPDSHLKELIIVCPEVIASDARRALQQTFAALGPTTRLDVSLRPWHGYLTTDTAALRSAISIAKHTTEVNSSILVLGESGLTDIPAPMVSELLHPPVLLIPFGPNGSVIGGIRPVPFLVGRAWAASKLYPPFVMPSSFLAGLAEDWKGDVWAESLQNVSSNALGRLSGLILEVGLDWDPTPPVDHRILSSTVPETTTPAIVSATPSFAFFLPTRSDLRRLVPLMCSLKTRHLDGAIRILIYDEETSGNGDDWETEQLEAYHCDINYQTLKFSDLSTAVLTRWLANQHIDIVLALSQHDYLTALLDTDILSLRNATLIKLPRSDLDSTEWMSSLSLAEWKSKFSSSSFVTLACLTGLSDADWHTPRVEISIITKDRPQSLVRLLDSLASARFFGDSLDIRVNVEQDCDLKTLQTVEKMMWAFGHVVIHRRVIHAGLLTAVVESWYPSSNDTYGLLLEDDIELSPLFYAWIKMTLLRYRHGSEENKTPHMFGISLYQQKHLELPLKGRQPFNPRTLLATEDIPHPTTPYLSQVPCSWGAIYFPEHWREFNDYLAARFAEIVLPIGDIIVPNVRSNQWSKSWKKFFIELVYLRGYVMLYPNYEGFVSLSTNHLEVGSHVKRRSAEQEELFVLPLMQLQKPRESEQLLEMPGHKLPELQDLPVLNLTGSMVSLDHLKEEGIWRRNGILGCETPTVLYDVRSLLCILEDA